VVVRNDYEELADLKPLIIGERKHFLIKFSQISKIRLKKFNWIDFGEMKITKWKSEGILNK